MRRSVPAMLNTPSRYSMSAARLPSRRKRARAPRHRARPPPSPPTRRRRRGARPALPKPCARSVLACTMRISRSERRRRRPRAARRSSRGPVPSPAWPRRFRSQPRRQLRRPRPSPARAPRRCPLPSTRGRSPCRARAGGRVSSRRRRAPRRRPIRRARSPCPSPARTGRCRRSSSSRWCRASARAGSCCAGEAPRRRSRSCARPRPSAAR